MQTEEQFDLDQTGKIKIDDIYNAPDPRQYFLTLRNLEYQIPERAKPVFQNIIRQYRETTQKQKVRILDVGCSYGINAALLKCDLTMEDLYERYTSDDATNASWKSLTARDRSLITSHTVDQDIEVIGLDRSNKAIDYAILTNFLNDGISENLEDNKPSTEAATILDNIDIVISTGCIGYVTANTLKWILKINAPRKPWMVNFVLRMFPFEEIAQELQNFGYESRILTDELYRQRRFANAEEQEQVLKRLGELNINPEGYENNGWFYAQPFLSKAPA